MKQAVVLCIGGSDSSGGAGIQADLKAVSACGCYGMSVVTAITAQNTLGVQDIYPVSPKFVAQQLEAVLSDIGADAVKTGMLLTAGVVQIVAKKIKEYNISKVVIDPVMMAKGGRSLMQDKALEAIVKKLLPLAFVVTPNIPEAERLTRSKIKSVDEIKRAAVLIHKLGAKNVLIKGGHLPGAKQSGAVDILYDGDKYYEFSAPWIDTRNTHGTGCTFASALAAEIASGKNVVAATGKAKKLVTGAIKNSLKIGAGHGPVNALFKYLMN
ncbi:MAG: bifunctional hydroxymethylpyrimidine kinase/phosphomethylpyrimidine kinase [Smithellaceae bacterium]|jgi:hydroxymethylpyrimidine kinase/phosphomethylpyrimidine kinase